MMISIAIAILIAFAALALLCSAAKDIIKASQDTDRDSGALFRRDARFCIPAILSLELMPVSSKQRGLSTTTGQFVLQSPLTFRSDRARLITVPAGFVSDLASIPTFADWFMDCDDQRIAAGAWVHDYLYSIRGALPHQQLTRKDCDFILAYEAMPELGATRLQSHIVYWALRIFGNRWSAPEFAADPTAITGGCQ